ncbi:MAG: folate family ECF transporter S component [Lachnospiraceae bacterium]|nr:folate family ECF transporter S component [Lachnospiraceae bacterium]
MQKLKNVRVLTVSAFLVAIATVLGFFKVPITELIEIRFQYLPIAVGGALFGPAVGGVIGMLADVLGYLVKPTGAFFPGFTISSILSGIIYGLFFFKKRITVPRIIAAELTETILCSLVINSINLSILYGNAFSVVVATRLLKVLIMFPIDTIILTVVLKAIPRLMPSEMKEGFVKQ